MSIVQSPYKLNHDPLFAGMICEGQLTNIVSKLNNTAVTIPFGTAVVRDGANGVKSPTPASFTEDVVGVTVRELNRGVMVTDPLTQFGHQPNTTSSVVTCGVVAVVVSEAVTVGAQAYVKLSNGQFGESDVPGFVGTPYKFLTSASAAGQIAQLSLVVGG